MTYYINPMWFYLMNVSEGIKIFLCFLGGISLVFVTFAIHIWLIEKDVDIMNLEDDEKKKFKLFKNIIVASIILLFIGILTPSKETCVEMMVTSQVTHESVSATKEEIYEIIDYITDKVYSEESEVKN